MLNPIPCVIQILLRSDMIWQSYGLKTGENRQKIVILGQCDEVMCMHVERACVQSVMDVKFLCIATRKLRGGYVLGISANFYLIENEG